MDSWTHIIAQRLGPPILTTSDEIRFNCWRPDCGNTPDSKYHLYVNTSRGKYFCQRCRRGGSLESLAKALKLPAPSESLTVWQRVINSFLFGDKDLEEDDTYVPWPQEYEKMIPGTHAHRYLLSRGISDKKIATYQIGFGIGQLKNRIILPDIDEDGNLVYWVARTYSNHKAKYKNATAPREKQIFNLGRIAQRGYRGRLVICEGPISAIVAGYDAVATYGKYVTGTQINRLATYGADEYVIAGDGDAVHEAVSLATRLYRRGLNVKFVRFSSDEDPASIGGLEIRRRIRNANKWHEFSAMEVLL